MKILISFFFILTFLVSCGDQDQSNETFSSDQGLSQEHKKEFKKDLIEVPKTILNNIEIIPVKNVDEVLKVALIKPLKRVEWVEVDQMSKKGKDKKEELSTH